MSKELFRECELKLRIESVQRQEELISVLNNLGYSQSNDITPTDYIVDTVDNSCKENNILFRVRSNIDVEKGKIIFTVKIKGDSEKFQDNLEIEVDSCCVDYEQVELLISVIKNSIGIELPKNIFSFTQMPLITKALYNLGFINCSLMQKKRKEYKGKISKVTFDIFPSPIGTYLEIESNNEEMLFETVHLLGLEDKKLEKRNYGQITKELARDKRFIIFNNLLFVDPQSGGPIYLQDVFTEL